jgi:NAD(P)H dehydrogenase (quinone)
VGSNRTHELAGDTSYTLAELVAELNRQTGRSVVYQDLTQKDFEGALFDAGHQLSTLIGRPTTPLAEAMRAALASA